MSTCLHFNKILRLTISHHFHQRTCTSMISKYRPWTKDQMDLHQSNRQRIKYMAEKEKSEKLAAASIKTQLGSTEDYSILLDKLCPLPPSSPDNSLFESQSASVEQTPPEVSLPLPLSDLVTQTPCAGCGAPLHAQDPTEPGYLPVEILQPIANDRLALRSTRCLRCSSLQNIQQLGSEASLGLTVSEDSARELLTHVREKEPNALVVLVVDICDLPHSVPRDLYSMLGPRKYVVVGTKTDLLPRDTVHGWKMRAMRALKKAAHFVGYIPTNQILDVHLVSSVTGYGIHHLVHSLLSPTLYSSTDPIYIVGSTNAGKSSLFNRLLKTDLCIPAAREHISPATVSYWPGTTLSLLKFPITRMSFFKRKEMVTLFHEDGPKREKIEEENLAAGHFRPLKGHVAMALADPRTRVLDTHEILSEAPTYQLALPQDGQNMDEGQPNVGGSLVPGNRALDSISAAEKLYSRMASMEERYYSKTRWCFDVPGILNSHQIINYLTAEELHVMLGREGRASMWLPRFFVVKKGVSLLLGGLGRLDILESGQRPVYLTVYSRLPLHMCPTTEVDDYMRDCAHLLAVPKMRPMTDHNSSVLVPPADPISPHEENQENEVTMTMPPPGMQIEDEGRNFPFPKEMRSIVYNLKPIQLREGEDRKRVSAVRDVVFSSAGWVSVHIVEEVCVCAFTPGAVGLCLRRPSMLPKMLQHRGERIVGTREFRVKEKIEPEKGFTAAAPRKSLRISMDDLMRRKIRESADQNGMENKQNICANEKQDEEAAL